jgi:hypothetical protein
VRTHRSTRGGDAGPNRVPRPPRLVDPSPTGSEAASRWRHAGTCQGFLTVFSRADDRRAFSTLVSSGMGRVRQYTPGHRSRASCSRASSLAASASESTMSFSEIRSTTGHVVSGRRVEDDDFHRTAEPAERPLVQLTPDLRARPPR